MILAPEYSFGKSVRKGFFVVGVTLVAGAIWSALAYFAPGTPSVLILPALQWGLAVLLDWRKHHRE